VRYPAGALQSVQTGCEAHPASYIQWANGVLSLEVTWLGRKNNPVMPSSAEFKKECSYTSAPPYAFMACTRTCL